LPERDSYYRIELMRTRQHNAIALVVVLGIAIALIAFWWFSKPAQAPTKGMTPTANSDVNFRGPVGQPYVNGPTDQPPGTH